MATGKCVAALIETDMLKQMVNDMSAWSAFDTGAILAGTHIKTSMNYGLDVVQSSSMLPKIFFTVLPEGCASVWVYLIWRQTR